MATTTPESFERDAWAVGASAHDAAVELMADALAVAGFERGVDILRRRGVLKAPMRLCQMAIAGVGTCEDDL